MKPPIYIRLSAIATIVFMVMWSPALAFQSPANDHALLLSLQNEQYQIRAQHADMMAQNREILREMQLMLELRAKVLTNAQDLQDLHKDYAEHKSQQGAIPVDIAILHQENSWILTGLGMIIVGGVSWMIRNETKQRKVLDALAKATRELDSWQGQVTGKVDTVLTRTDGILKKVSDDSFKLGVAEGEKHSDSTSSS